MKTNKSIIIIVFLIFLNIYIVDATSDYSVSPTMLQLKAMNQTQTISINNSGDDALEFEFDVLGPIKNITEIPERTNVGSGEVYELNIAFYPSNINYSGDIAIIPQTEILEPTYVRVQITQTNVSDFFADTYFKRVLLRLNEGDILGVYVIVIESLGQTIHVIPKINVPVQKFWIPAIVFVVYLLFSWKWGNEEENIGVFWFIWKFTIAVLMFTIVGIFL